MARDGASKTLTNEQILRMLYACGPGLCTSVFASIKYKSPTKASWHCLVVMSGM